MLQYILHNTNININIQYKTGSGKKLKSNKDANNRMCDIFFGGK